MSGRRAGRERREHTSESQIDEPWEYLGGTARAVLDVDFSMVPLQSRLEQVAIGLCRAAFAQLSATATLARDGLGSAASPNRRLIFEIAIRLAWLVSLSRDDRHRAVDTMLEHDRKDVHRQVTFLDSSGNPVNADLTELDEYLLEAEKGGRIHQESTRLRQAVDAATSTTWSLYWRWLDETPRAHASAFLAGRYAPTFDQESITVSAPEESDANYEVLQLTATVIVMTTQMLLHDENMPEEHYSQLGDAFFGFGDE